MAPARVSLDIRTPTSPRVHLATLSSIERRAPHGFGMFLTRLVTDPPAPLPGILALFWLARPRDDLALPAVIEICRLRSAVRHRVTVGIVGSPSSGKDAAMAAIFGIHTGNIDPVAGSTKQVEIRRLPESTALYVVNTPGMGDVIESVTEEARQVLDQAERAREVRDRFGGGEPARRFLRRQAVVEIGAQRPGHVGDAEVTAVDCSIEMLGSSSITIGHARRARA